MSLQFTGGSSDVVACGTSAPVNDLAHPFYAAWIYPTLAAFGMVISKEDAGANFQKEFAVQTTGQIDIFTRYTTSGSRALSDNSAGNKLTANAWWYVAYGLDSSLVPHIYIAQLGQVVDEIATYAVQVNAVGSPWSENNGPIRLGNNAGLVNSFAGRVACMAYGDVNDTNANILALARKLQYAFFKSDTRIAALWQLGLFGTGTQPDWGGAGRNGTVTGATVAPHVPIPQYGLQIPISEPTAGAAASDSQPAFLTGAGTGTPASDSQPAYLSGSLTASASQPCYLAAVASITLNAGTTYQVVKGGWSATGQAGQEECSGYLTIRDGLLDDVINNLGLKRIRLEIHTTTTSSEVLDNTAVEFQGRIENTILQLCSLMAAKGQHLYFNVCFSRQSGFGSPNMQSYADEVVRVYQWMDATYGFVPDAWEIALEPNVVTPQFNSASAMLDAINRVNSGLVAAGYTPYLIVPSLSSTGASITMWNEIINANGGTLPAGVGSFCWHEYDTPSTQAQRQTIAGYRSTYGVDTMMLEHIAETYARLHLFLKEAEASAFQQYALAYCTTDNGAQYYTTTPTTYTMSATAKYFLQYFRHIRDGATRIGASSSDGTFDPLAFVNLDGTYVVVILATAGGDLQVSNLPAGTYGIYYTTATDQDHALADQVASGGTITTSIPDAGVITIYGILPKAFQPAYLYGLGQALMPDGDIGQSGSWQNELGGATLYASIDEWPAPSDSDYVWHNDVSGAEYFEVSLENPSGIVGPGNVVIHWRGNDRAATGTCQVTVELREGTTVIASNTQILPNSETTFMYTLTAAEKAAITDWTNLRLRVTVV